MNIKEQILTIPQVQELKGLGFDVEKHSSMCWVFDRLFSKEDDTTKAITIQCPSTPTMTVADILEVLPKEIEKDNEKYNLFIAYVHGSISIYYDIVNKIGNLSLIVTGDLIDGLFETLKWCIKNKHIAL